MADLIHDKRQTDLEEFTAPAQVFEVTVTKWADVEGLEKQEIGRLTIRGTPTGTNFQDFSFQIDENGHPLVPVPLRLRGTLFKHPARSTVWSLIQGVLSRAMTMRPN